jgi:hypothetical protein
VAVPTAYTEAELAAYLHDTLNAGGYADDLGWVVADGDYDEVVNDALIAIEADAIEDVSGRTSIARLRALGRVALWRRVMAATIAEADTRVGNASVSMGKIHDHARAMLAEAEADANQYIVRSGFRLRRMGANASTAEYTPR